MELESKNALERQLEVAEQITHIGSWHLDLATNAITWSDELYRIYGLEPRSCPVTLDSFLGRVHPDDRAMVQREVATALEKGGRFQWSERIVRPDGSVRSLDSVGEVVRDAGGRPLGLIGTCRDVTNERARDQTIRQYADIVRNVQIGLSTWEVGDPEDPSTYRLTTFNPAAEAIARRPLGDALGKSFREIVPYAAGGQLEQLIQGVARDRRVREASALGSRDARDPTRAVTMKAFPLPGGGVGVALEDITEPTRTRRLQAAEHRVFEMLAEGAPLGDVLASLVVAIEQHSPPSIGVITLREPVAGVSGRVAPSLGGRSTDGMAIYAATPILAQDERDLGDFTLYTPSERKQREGDAQVVERAAQVARIAIERCLLEEQLRELSAHVEDVREEERTGIAREIHDELGQALTALKLDIAWIARRSMSESMTLTKKGLLEKLEAMSKMTDEVIGQVRRISAELRPGVLDDLGLLAAIEWQASEFTARTGVECFVRAGPIEQALDKQLSTTVFRIFQEALTNISRHAEATRVDVELGVKNGVLRLLVCDDGKGVSASDLRSSRSLGLIGMRERARRHGGTADIACPDGRGTHVALEIPLPTGGPR